MKLLTVVVLILQVVQVKPLVEVSGYLGDTITLKSGADPKWNLSKIEWSIFSNHTWIATYRRGKKNTERVSRYAGRLNLNTSSGDLMIQHLNKNDAMQYTVDLLNTDEKEKVNKINLTVRERLLKPTVLTDTILSVKEECLMVLNCSSPDNGVSYSWDVTPSSVYTTNRSSAHLVVFLNTAQNFVNFTCNTNRNMEHASHVVTLKCDSKINNKLPTPEPKKSQPRERFAFYFLTGLLVGVLGTITVITVYCFRAHITAAFQWVKEKLCS